MSDITIIIINSFNMGFLSGIHCIGMCGGIINIFIYISKKNNLAILKYVLFANIGRIISYSIACVLINSINLILSKTMHIVFIYFLKILSSILIIYVGLNLIGFCNDLSIILKANLYIWKTYSYKLKEIIPINSIYKSILFGLFWGTIPCSLVYTNIIWSCSQKDLINPLILVLFFGLGTIPIIIISTLISKNILYLINKHKVKAILGLIILIFGVINLIVNIRYIYNFNH